MDFSLISSPKYFFEEMYGDQSGEWRLIQQQNVNVIWWQESTQKGLKSTSGAQFASLALIKPVVWFAHVVINWCSCSVAKSALYVDIGG